MRARTRSVLTVLSLLGPVCGVASAPGGEVSYKAPVPEPREPPAVSPTDPRTTSTEWRNDVANIEVVRKLIVWDKLTSNIIAFEKRFHSIQDNSIKLI